MLFQNLPPWLEGLASCGMEGIVYSNHLNFSPQLQSFVTAYIVLVLVATLMACLGMSSLRGLLPFWVKHFISTRSVSDQSYTSFKRNTSPQAASHQSPVNSGYVPGIIVLPDPPPAYLTSAVHRGVDNGYQEYEPPFHRTPPLDPPIIFPKHAADRPMNDLCGQVKFFIKYYGVTYRPPDSMQYVWLFVQYHDSSTGHVGVSLQPFNSDVRLQERLESIVPDDEWQWLEQKYGLELGRRSKPWWLLV